MGVYDWVCEHYGLNVDGSVQVGPAHRHKTFATAMWAQAEAKKLIEQLELFYQLKAYSEMCGRMNDGK